MNCQTYFKIGGTIVALDWQLVSVVLRQTRLGIPEVSTGRPGQDRHEGAAEVEHCPGQHDDVVGVQPGGHDSRRVSHT